MHQGLPFDDGGGGLPLPSVHSKTRWALVNLPGIYSPPFFLQLQCCQIFQLTPIQLNSHQGHILTLHCRWKGVARWCRSVLDLGDKKTSVEKGKGSGEWYFSRGGGGDVDLFSNWTNERSWIILIWTWFLRRLDCYDGQGNLVAARSVTIVTCAVMVMNMLLWWWWWRWWWWYVFCLL